MTWCTMPALIALLLKVCILIANHNKTWANNSWKLFVGVFAIHNLCEVLAFTNFVRDVPAIYIIRSYHVLALIVITMGINYVNIDRSKWAYVMLIIFTPVALTLSLLTVFTNTIVEGVLLLPYSISSEHGPFYLIYQLTILAGTFSIMAIIIYGFVFNKTQAMKVAHGYNFLALLPLAITTIIITVLILFDIRINAAMVIPLASTFFLAVSIKGKASQEVNKDPRELFYFSAEATLARQMETIRSQYMLENIGHKEVMNKLEITLVNYKHAQNDQNISQTARSMRVRRTTLYNMMYRLGIKTKNMN